MMRSLSSGVAGLRTHQTRMDVIGNNISNVNTYGFKSSRATFADVYYQNLAGASAGTTGVQGGKNATQIGYGASIATIDVQNAVSGASSTDFAMDVYIAGDGFLVTKDTDGKMGYTRLGKLGFDSAGNLVDGNGNLVQGFPMNEDGTPNIRPDGTIEASDLKSIVGDPEILSKLTGISISPSGMIVGTLEGDKVIKTATSLPSFIDKESISINADSNYVGDVKLSIGAMPTSTDVTSWFTGASVSGTAYSPTVTNVQFGDVGLPTSGTSVSYSFSVNGKNFTMKVNDTSDPNNSATYEGTVQEDGTVVLKSKNSGKIAMTFTVDKQPAADTKIDAASAKVDAGMLALKYQVTTRDKGDNVVKLPETANGEPSVLTLTSGPQTLDNLNGISITIDSSKADFKPTVVSIGTAAPGDQVLYAIGNLALAKFPNPNGMTEEGSSYFAQTANSGEPVFVKPGVDGTGALKAGYLEMSNVDVSKEFTDMITTQRGFQANSRIITVSDNMLEELVNLKR